MSVWTSPALLLGLLLSIGYASLFHLWGGRGVRDLIAYIIAAVIGFGLGQLIGLYTRVPWLEIGQLHLLEGTIGAWIAIAGVYMLGQEQASDLGH